MNERIWTMNRGMICARCAAPWYGTDAEVSGRPCPTCGMRAANQSRVAAWTRETFGEDSASNTKERCLRAAEEVVELAQACSVDAETCHRLVDYVFSRPAGKPAQEIAGCLLTLYAAASAIGADADAKLEVELERVQRPEVVERCRRRQSEKREALKLSTTEDNYRGIREWRR